MTTTTTTLRPAGFFLNGQVMPVLFPQWGVAFGPDDASYAYKKSNQSECSPIMLEEDLLMWLWKAEGRPAFEDVDALVAHLNTLSELVA